MSTPVYSDTLGGMAITLAEMMDDRLEDGTADSGSSSTIVDDILVDADDSRLLGRWVLITAGAAAGDERRVSVFTAGSDRITATPNFSATIDTTSKYLVTERRRPTTYLKALQQAQHMIGGTNNFKEVIDRSIILGSPLNNGTFYNWTAGTSSAPDGWTLAGASAAVAQETTQTRFGIYSAKITSASAEASLSQSLTRIGRYRGQSIKLDCWVWNNTSGEVTISLTDGVTTKSKSNSGSSFWEYLETDSFIVTANASELTSKLAVLTGTKIGYFSTPWMPNISVENEYDILAAHNAVKLDGYLELSRVPVVAGAGQGTFDFENEIGPEAWEILHEPTRRIKLATDGYHGHVLGFRGGAEHAELTAVTTAWTGNQQALLWRAKQLLHLQRGEMEQSQAAWSLANQFERRFAMALSAPKTVEPN